MTRQPLFVLDEGPRGAPVLLLVHGFTSSTHSWDPVIPELTDRFRVIRVDLLGHGRTGGPAADAPEQAEALRDRLDELDVTGVTAVGHSFGADVVVELAVICDRVSRTVVVAQAPDYSEATLPRGSALMTGRRGALLLAAARPAIGALAVVAARRPPPGALGAMAATGLRDLRAMDPGMFDVVLRRRAHRLQRRPLDAVLAATGRPGLVVLGGRDGFYGDRPAARYRAAGAQVEVLPTAGHAMPVEQPTALADAITRFAAP